MKDPQCVPALHALLMVECFIQTITCRNYTFGFNILQHYSSPLHLGTPFLPNKSALLKRCPSVRARQHPVDLWYMYLLLIIGVHSRRVSSLECPLREGPPYRTIFMHYAAVWKILYVVYIVWLFLSLPLGDDLHIKLDTLQTTDVELALQHTKPSARGLARKYEAWQKDFESV